MEKKGPREILHYKMTVGELQNIQLPEGNTR